MSNMKEDLDMTPPRGWICYDGKCGACSAFVGRNAAFFARRGFGVVPLQEEWVRERVGERDATAPTDILLLRPHGEIARGSEVYRKVGESVFGLGPLVRLSRLPPFNWGFDALYRFVATNRNCISKACGFNPRRG